MREGVGTIQMLERGNAMSKNVSQICKKEICKLLTGHVQSPLKNMREEDFRATLLSMLRRRFKETVPALVEPVSGSRAERLLQGKKSIEDKTSRVHAEVKLGDDQQNGNEKDRIDLAVLRRAHVRFMVKKGVTDVQASIRPKDVAVLIEVKAAPLNHSSTKKGLENDIEKLACYYRRNRVQLCFLVFIDKSLSLGLVDDGKDSGRIQNFEKFLREKVKRHVKGVQIYYLGRKSESSRKIVPKPFTMRAA